MALPLRASPTGICSSDCLLLVRVVKLFFNFCQVGHCLNNFH